MHPRWAVARAPAEPVPLHRYLADRLPLGAPGLRPGADPRMLVAGCGTGRSALELALAYAKGIGATRSVTSVTIPARSSGGFSMPPASTRASPFGPATTL